MLSSVDLNGDNRNKVLQSADYLAHPFALTVFEVRFAFRFLIKFIDINKKFKFQLKNATCLTFTLIVRVYKFD